MSSGVHGAPTATRSAVEPSDVDGELVHVLISEEEIAQRLAELAEQIDDDYRGDDLVLIGVLKGAIMVMADLSRALRTPATIDWMAVSSYGSGSKSSGVVRILKDIDTDIADRNVLIVEDVLDSGLTLEWLKRTLGARRARSLRVMTLLRKPEAIANGIEVDYLGFDVPNEFVVGYGLDYRQRYRNLRCIATVAPALLGRN